MGLPRGPDGQRQGGGVGNFLWIGMGVLATVFGVLAGPKILADQHELMCGWSSGWQRLAGRFGDCAAYARAQPEGTDPVANAKRRIAVAGYTTTNADFIKAVARGESEVVGAFQALGVRGDEQSLRTELLKSPVGSAEFTQLAEFMAKAHSQHYASRPREEIKDVLNQMQTSKSVDVARNAACGRGGKGSFADDLLRINLSQACADEARWVEAVIGFAKKVLTGFEDESMVWWHMNAAGALRYVPTAASKIPLEEFASRVKNGVATAGYFQIDADFSILPNSGNISAVEVFVTPTDNSAYRFPFQGEVVKDCMDEDPKRDDHLMEAQVRQMHKDFDERFGQKAGMRDLSDSRNYAYNAKPPRPKCIGTLTFLTDARGLGIVTFSNVRSLSGSARR